MNREQLRRSIAERIRAWRHEGDLELEAVGERVGVSVRTVQRWEAAATEPNATDLLLMESLRPGLVESIFFGAQH